MHRDKHKRQNSPLKISLSRPLVPKRACGLPVSLVSCSLPNLPKWSISKNHTHDVQSPTTITTNTSNSSSSALSRRRPRPRIVTDLSKFHGEHGWNQEPTIDFTYHDLQTWTSIIQHSRQLKNTRQKIAYWPSWHSGPKTKVWRSPRKPQGSLLSSPVLAPVPFDTSPLFVLDHDPDPAAPKQESRSQSDGDLSQMISSFRHLVKVMKQAHKQCNIELKSILIQIDTEPDFKPMRDLCRTIRNTPLAKLMMPAVCRQYINELLELSRTYFFSLIPTRMLQSFCQLSRLVENIESEAWMFDYMVKPLHERIPNEINSIVFNIDKEGCVSYVSAAIRDVLGLDPKGLLGLPPRFANLSRPVPNIACTHADGRVIFLESKCVFQNKDDTNPSTWTLRPRQPISPSIPGTPLAPSPDSETLCHVCEKHVPVVLFPSHSLICLDMHAQEMQLILLRATIQTLQQTVSDALALLNEEWEAERDDAANAEYCRFLSRLVVIGEGVREWLTRASRSDFIEPIPPLKMIEEDFLPESGPDALPIAEALLTVADQLWEGVQEANATGDAIFTLSATITEKRRVFKEQSTAEEAYRNQSLKAQDRPSSPAVGAERPASIKDYDVLKPISKGSFGRVFLAKKKLTGEYFAIKVLKKQDMVKKNQLSNVALERTILTQLDSPYIVKMYFSFQTGDNIYLVMEYLNGGDCAALLKSMGHLDEKWARFYMCEITLGLEFLHGRDVVHRDLKPDNLLIDAQGHLKLTDFGLSKVGFLGRRIDDRRDSTTPNSPVNRRSSIAHSPLRRSSISSATSSQHEASTPVFGSRIADKTDKFVGTPDYLAPESVLGTSQEAPVDWWAAGVILYEFLHGYPPFHAEHISVIFQNIVNRTLDFDETLTPDCLDIIDQLLILDVDERLGTAGAESVKDHAWFSSVNWDTIQDKPGPFCPTTGDIEDTTYFDNRGLTMEFESDSSTSRGDVYKNYTLLDKQNQLMLGKMRLQKEQEHGSGEWPRRGCSLDIRTSAGEHSRHRSYGATELFRELAGINGPILVCDPHDAYCTAIVPLCSHVTHVKTPADAEQALAETSFETVFVAVDLGLARDGRMIAGESIVDMVRNSKLNSVSRVVALADQGVGWSDGNLPFPFSAQAFKEFIK